MLIERDKRFSFNYIYRWKITYRKSKLMIIWANEWASNLNQVATKNTVRLPASLGYIWGFRMEIISFSSCSWMSVLEHLLLHWGRVMKRQNENKNCSFTVAESAHSNVEFHVSTTAWCTSVLTLLIAVFSIMLYSWTRLKKKCAIYILYVP